MSQSQPPPRGLLDRVDKAIYDGETAVAIGALYVMTIAYVLTVLQSNMRRGINTFDEFLIGLWGYATPQAAPPETIDSITGLWSPLVLSSMTFLLALLAIRTRENAGRPDDAPPLKVNWGKRLLWSGIVTAGMYGLLKLTEVVPAGYLVVLSIVALAAGVYIHRDRVPLAAIVAGLIGAVAMSYFFITVENWTHSGISLVLMIYVGFFGASMATRDNRHIRVDAIRKSIKGKGYHLYEAVGNLVTAGFSGLFGVLAATYLRPGEQHGKSELPMTFIVIPIAAAFLLMAVRFLIQGARSFGAYRRGELAPTPELELH